MTQFFFHPLTTFVAGGLVTMIFLGVFLSSISGPNNSAEWVKTYKTAMTKVNGSGNDADLEQFTNFLKGISSKDFIKLNTTKVYSEDTYLNDTLVTHHSAKEIENYFLKTADTMTSFDLTIDDTFTSGKDHYIRWTMIFAAPALGKGESVHSVGISQVRFNKEGKVAFHQDFWDSGSHIFGQIPISGGLIEIIRKRMK